jgi:hypothetical protein
VVATAFGTGAAVGLELPPHPTTTMATTVKAWRSFLFRRAYKRRGPHPRHETTRHAQDTPRLEL